jgi:hypothetical protein
MAQFFFGVLAGLMLTVIAVSVTDKGEKCERTSGDSVWTRKKEVVPCPTK